MASKMLKCQQTYKTTSEKTLKVSGRTQEEIQKRLNEEVEKMKEKMSLELQNKVKVMHQQMLQQVPSEFAAKAAVNGVASTMTTVNGTSPNVVPPNVKVTEKHFQTETTRTETSDQGKGTNVVTIEGKTHEKSHTSKGNDDMESKEEYRHTYEVPKEKTKANGNNGQKRLTSTLVINLAPASTAVPVQVPVPVPIPVMVTAQTNHH